MKKIVLLFAAALCAMAVMATEYTGSLSVSINGLGSTQDNVNVTIVQNEDGTYRLNLNNFKLITPDTTVPVGNIVVDNVPAVKACGCTALAASKDILISAGTSDEPFWLGPTLGEVPISLNALFNDNEMRVHIDINLTTHNQIIEVVFETPGADTPSGGGIKGDVNGDSKVDVEDVNAVINIILKV